MLSGASTPAILDSTLAARDIAVDPDMLADLAEPADRYWATRSELSWT